MSRSYRVTLIVLGLLITTAASAQRQEPAKREDGIRSRAAVAVDGLQKDLRQARRLLADIDDRKLREQLELLLWRAALKAHDLEALIANSPRSRVKRPISAANFAKLIKNIKDQSFDDDKVEFIETFVKGRPLNCEQATEILKALSFDEGRVKAAIVLYPGLVDPENFFEVLKIFPFDSNRKKVMEALKKKD